MPNNSGTKTVETAGIIAVCLVLGIKFLPGMFKQLGVNNAKLAGSTIPSSALAQQQAGLINTAGGGAQSALQQFLNSLGLGKSPVPSSPASASKGGGGSAGGGSGSGNSGPKQVPTAGPTMPEVSGAVKYPGYMPETWAQAAPAELPLPGGLLPVAGSASNPAFPSLDNFGNGGLASLGADPNAGAADPYGPSLSDGSFVSGGGTDPNTYGPSLSDGSFFSGGGVDPNTYGPSLSDGSFYSSGDTGNTVDLGAGVIDWGAGDSGW